MIHKLEPSEPFDEIRKDLDYTLRRLLRDPRTPDLSLCVSKLIEQLDALTTEGGSSGPVPGVLPAFLDLANEERCKLLGELTFRACKSALNPGWPATFFRQAQTPQPDLPSGPSRRGPSSVDDWLAVANERASDARANLAQRPSSTGPVYLAGYAIECSLKALLRAMGKPFPTARSAGHDLQGLWEASGFRLSDLRDASGAKSFFIEQWTTDLRYEAAMVFKLPAEGLLAGAGDLTGWIQTRVRRSRGRR